MSNFPSHRPRCKGHDYYDRGIYLITIVVKNRDHLLGELNLDIHSPAVDLTPLGQAVLDEWGKTPEIQLRHNRHVSIMAACVMPDHFHGVLFVKERLDVSVGRVIMGFKSACTVRWRALTGMPSLASTTTPDRRPLIAMSRPERARYYATLPRDQQPLFDDNYDDSFLWARGQLEAMIAYVYDNPRRAIIKALFPQYMQLRLCLVINGVRYSAFGNMLLLRMPVKEQVFCHRKARVVQLSDAERQRLGYTAPSYHPDTKSSLDYTQTEAWQRERDAWIHDAEEGVVLVTPGISPGERDMKNIAINRCLPLIHLQKEPITRKPEKARFDACAAGALLILAPWPEDLDSMPSQIGAREVTAYDRFHNMNLLARQICQINITTLQMTFRVMGGIGGILAYFAMSTYKFSIIKGIIIYYLGIKSIRSNLLNE